MALILLREWKHIYRYLQIGSLCYICLNNNRIGKNLKAKPFGKTNLHIRHDRRATHLTGYLTAVLSYTELFLSCPDSNTN